MRRRWRRIAVAVLFAGLGTLASACGNGGAALAKQACGLVGRSLSLYRAAQHDPNPATASAKRTKALTELRQALRPAALAGSAGGAYQALQATLQESDRVPESDLVSALTAQCAAVTNPASGSE